MNQCFAFGISRVGGRPNNEDCIFPAEQTVWPNDRLFMVCDGVGGLNKGEDASSLVCQSISGYFRIQPPDLVDKPYVDQAVAYAEQALTNHILTTPESQGMGSTFTLLALHEAGCTIGWCGDSRVYQVRAGQIIFRTEDHSLVGELVRQGVLSLEDARQHPRRNVILRCLTGTHEPAQVDIALRSDVQSGDYFFLCTDGVLEVVMDELLAAVLGNGNLTNEQKSRHLFTCCQGHTRDNFSFYLIQVC